METESSSAAAATSIEYEVAYGRAGSLEEALAQMNLAPGTTAKAIGTPATNTDVDEQHVLEAAIEQTESVVAEVPITVREGQKRVRRNIFIYASPQTHAAKTSAPMEAH